MEGMLKIREKFSIFENLLNFTQNMYSHVWTRTWSRCGKPRFNFLGCGASLLLHAVQRFLFVNWGVIVDDVFRKCLLFWRISLFDDCLFLKLIVYQDHVVYNCHESWIRRWFRLHFYVYLHSHIKWLFHCHACLISLFSSPNWKF